MAIDGGSHCIDHRPVRKAPAGGWSNKTKEGYDYRWQKLRRMILRRNPLCEICGMSPANEVHHLQRRKDGGTDELDNLQCLCKSCHSKETAKERRKRKNFRVGGSDS